MGYVIAVAGKGGTGKTTISALLVRLLKEKKPGAILAVDADPNSNLAEALGLEVKETIGQILDGIAAHPDKVPAGMTKDRFIEYKVQTAVQEAEGFDVLTMGRPEGPGCYCYVNNVLRNAMATLIKDYAYVIIDNEAGLEHLSRRTSRSADVLLVVSDATSPGLRAAKRIGELVRELKIQTKKNLLLVNRSDEPLAKERLNGMQLTYLGFLPHDEQITKISMKNNALSELAKDAASLTALGILGDKIWQSN